MVGKRISTKDDFPRVQVYREDAARGPVFSIAFKNKEQRSLLNQTCWMLGTPLAMMAYFNYIAGPLIEDDFYPALLILSAFPLMAIMMRMVFVPTSSWRIIELDYGANRLRVLRNGSQKVARELKRLRNLTVEPHPMAQREAAEKRGVLGPFQKQHCLFGWFGARGAEKVMLLARWEWPNQDSLFEVRQAVLWAMEKQGEGVEAEQAAAAWGMTPPLD